MRRALSAAATRIEAHAWTVLADLRHQLAPPPVPAWTPWQATAHDDTGPVALRGCLSVLPAADTAVLIVHGFGGSADSGYARLLAAAAARRGWSSLRLHLRGAGGCGEDVYHAGLHEDLELALASPDLSGHDRLYAVGVSLGGHVTLCLGLHAVPRLAGVAALSAPLDLARSCAAIDRRRGWPYRKVVLRALADAYRPVAERHGGGRRAPTDADALRRVATIAAWDEHVVVPRFGFNSVADYHESMSVGPRLRSLRCPALYVGAEHDPMVPGWTVQPSLDAAGDAITSVMLPRGGHVGLPAPALAPDTAPRLMDQMLGWLDANARTPTNSER